MFALGFLSVFLNPLEAFAQDFTPYSPLVNLPYNASNFTGEPSTFANVVNGWIQLIIALAAMLAVVMIVIGGIRYMITSASAAKGVARSAIARSIGGLLLALGAWIILNTINPALVTDLTGIAPLDVSFISCAPFPNDAGYYYGEFENSYNDLNENGVFDGDDTIIEASCVTAWIQEPNPFQTEQACLDGYDARDTTNPWIQRWTEDPICSYFDGTGAAVDVNIRWRRMEINLLVDPLSPFTPTVIQSVWDNRADCEDPPGVLTGHDPTDVCVEIECVDCVAIDESIPHSDVFTCTDQQCRAKPIVSAMLSQINIVDPSFANDWTLNEAWHHSPTGIDGSQEPVPEPGDPKYCVESGDCVVIRLNWDTTTTDYQRLADDYAQFYEIAKIVGIEFTHYLVHDEDVIPLLPFDVRDELAARTVSVNMADDVGLVIQPGDAGGGPTTGGDVDQAILDRMNQSDEQTAIANELTAHGILISSSLGGTDTTSNFCTTVGEPGCTNVGGYERMTIDRIKDIYTGCATHKGGADACDIVVTGGTEWFLHGGGVDSIQLNSTRHKPRYDLITEVYATFPDEDDYSGPRDEGTVIDIRKTAAGGNTNDPDIAAYFANQNDDTTSDNCRNLTVGPRISSWVQADDLICVYEEPTHYHIEFFDDPAGVGDAIPDPSELSDLVFELYNATTDARLEVINDGDTVNLNAYQLGNGQYPDFGVVVSGYDQYGDIMAPGDAQTDIFMESMAFNVTSDVWPIGFTNTQTTPVSGVGYTVFGDGPGVGEWYLDPPIPGEYRIEADAHPDPAGGGVPSLSETIFFTIETDQIPFPVYIYNADTDSIVTNLSDAGISLAGVGTNNINLGVEETDLPNTTNYVKFRLSQNNGNSEILIEEDTDCSPRYVVFGDSGIQPWDPQPPAVGNYTFTVEVYENGTCGGGFEITQGDLILSRSITFDILDTNGPSSQNSVANPGGGGPQLLPPETTTGGNTTNEPILSDISLELWNADVDTRIREISDGESIDLTHPSIQTNNVSIVAIPIDQNGTPISDGHESAQFILNGGSGTSLNEVRDEEFSSGGYPMNGFVGASTRNINEWSPQPPESGLHSLEVRLFDGAGGTGGTVLTRSFNLEMLPTEEGAMEIFDARSGITNGNTIRQIVNGSSVSLSEVGFSDISLGINSIDYPLATRVRYTLDKNESTGNGIEFVHTQTDCTPVFGVFGNALVGGDLRPWDPLPIDRAEYTVTAEIYQGGFCLAGVGAGGTLIDQKTTTFSIVN